MPEYQRYCLICRFNRQAKRMSAWVWQDDEPARRIIIGAILGFLIMAALTW